MTDRMLYTIRGWAYTAECLNPFRSTVSIDGLPLGLKLRAYKRDAVGRGLYRRKIHEPALTNLLLTRFASPGSRNFIDAGANIGYFSCLMAKLAGPAGKVLAVEPEPKNLELLRGNLKINGLANIAVQACALGATEGSARLGIYKPSNRGRHSIVDAGERASIEVPVRRLDAIVEASGLQNEKWALMKIDVEGYEGFVLEGAKETLPHVETLVMEYSPDLLKKADLDPASTLNKLSVEFPRISRIDKNELVSTTVEECLGHEIQMELVFHRE
jgi:FkbM family methyltransferase